MDALFNEKPSLFFLSDITREDKKCMKDALIES